MPKGGGDGTRGIMYILIWEFQVKNGCEAQFERVYGPEGAWVKFFRKGEGYLGTELLKKDDRIYITIDRWKSKEVYKNFKSAYLAEYKAIDKHCESLTESEKPLGSFFRIE